MSNAGRSIGLCVRGVYVEDVQPIVLTINNGSNTDTKLANDISDFVRMEIDGVVQSSVVGTYKWQYSGRHTIKYYSGTNRVSDNAFKNCTTISQVDVGSSVTSIGNSAFYGCYNLQSLTNGTNLTSIGDSAFYGCTKLGSSYIPNGVTHIGGWAFYNCFGIVYVAIPNSVTSIGNKAFYGCNNQNFRSVTIPSSVVNIGTNPFAKCRYLTTITVNSNNTNYDSRDNCNAIIRKSDRRLITGCKNTVIPNTVTTLGDYAFEDCRGLTSITIPSSVTAIGDNLGNQNRAFSGCTSLTSITCLRRSAPTLNRNAMYVFRDIASNGTLYVPSGSSGYDTWMQNANYYLGLYGWTKVEQ